MIGRLLLCLFRASAFHVSAQDTARIVDLGVDGDPYYEPQPAYTGLSLKDRNRPVDGARVAMRGTRVLGRALGISFELEERLISPDADPS